MVCRIIIPYASESLYTGVWYALLCEAMVVIKNMCLYKTSSSIASYVTGVNMHVIQPSSV